MSMLFTMIAGSNPAQYQLDFALWTRDLVRQVIATRFGVELSVGSVGRILRGLGMSPQRPLHRATQQDPARVARWRTEEVTGQVADVVMSLLVAMGGLWQA
jgi:transposase